MQLHHGTEGSDSRFDRFQQAIPNFHAMRMPMRHQQDAHLRHGPLQAQNERLSLSGVPSFPAPLVHDRMVKPWASHELSNDDDGETSSASEDSTASSKRATEAPAQPLPPSSKRARTNLQQPGWLPVSETKTFQTGITQPQQQQQERLPRLAALETLLSPANHQQENIHQRPQHHRRGGYPMGPHAPTTGVLVRSNAPPMQLPPLADAARDSLPSITNSSRSSSTSSSPTCSPGLRSSSPAAYGGSYRLQPPAPPAPPACIQGQGGTAGTSAGGSVNQRWLEAPTSGVGGNGSNDMRHTVPRIEALSNPGSRHAVANADSRQQSWHSSAPASEAGTQAAAKSAGESRGDFFAPKTTGQYSVYRVAQEDRMHSDVRGRQQEIGAPWALQQHHQQEDAWQNHHQTATLQTIPTENPSIKASRSSSSTSSAATAAPSSSSRTPSPVSFYHQGRGHRGPPPPLQHPFPASPSPSSSSPSTSTAASISTSSPERAVGKRSWTPPGAADERTNDRGSPARVRGGGRGGRGGKWDEEAQESAEGSVGKQILQRYLSHLYPKASREVWSHDEEEVLWRAQKEYGNAWSYISSLLPGRSENAVKNHWYTQMRMFIGQRGNNASSKPCPPKSASRPASGRGCGGRQNKRRPNDDSERSEALRQQQQRRASPPGSPAGAGAAAPAAAVAAAPSPEHEKVPDSFDVTEEKQARADAVAALGMLFSQGPTASDATPRADDSSSSSRR